ncbi:MAG: HEAT repeat domain-containing protein [Longimicrobiales bacterium]
MMRALLLLSLLLVAPRLAAQSAAPPAQRDGDVRIRYATRAGVCGYPTSNGIRVGSDSYGQVFAGRGRAPDECREGPAVVTVRLAAGRATRVDLRVGWPELEAPAEALTPAAAADYLLSLSERATSRAAERLVRAAALADAEVWPRLLELARRDSGDASRASYLWLSILAGWHVTQASARSAVTADDIEVRRHAIFAVSQRPRSEALPALTQIARANPEPELRRTALFWLGQTHEPSVLDLFEAILRSAPASRRD